MTTHKQPESNDLAIASLVLGILSLTGMGALTGIPAVITGWMGMKNPHNKGMALAGFITGIISIIGTILIILFFVLLMLLGVFAAAAAETGESTDSYQPTDSNHYQQRA